MNKKFFGLMMIAASMLFAISCSQDEGEKGPGTGKEKDGEEVIVTFSLATEDAMSATRAISDGTGADMLVYAVYSKDETEKTGYRLLEYYGTEDVIDEEGTFESTIVPGKGQTVMATKQLLEEEGQKITLRLMRGKTYYFAFWAQNHKCKAYDTSDLEQVEVKYTAEDGSVLNNDELRDAFCASYSFEVQPNIEVKVVLTRAVAQINVGTSGWDYNEEVDYGYSYLYSKIKLDGVYRFINVLKDEVVTDKSELKSPEGIEEVTTVVEYDWNKIPAYLNIDVPSGAEAIKTLQPGEELLKVKLTPSEEWLGYLPTIPVDNTPNVNGIYTEEFKYLSMCYVLIPAHRNQDGKDDFDNKKFATPLNSVSLFLAENEDGTVSTGGYSDDTAGKMIFEIYNVPAQRNWRTNILGGAGRDNSLFNPRLVRVYVDIEPSYKGEHNTGNSTGSWVEWSN